ncbi:hypothetical protein DEDE109153_15245 [Deinococcus deserti]
MKRILSLLAVTAALSASASASSVMNVSIASKELGRDWSYNVYLPTGYNPSKANYPVLYLLHGNGGNEND